MLTASSSGAGNKGNFPQKFPQTICDLEEFIFAVSSYRHGKIFSHHPRPIRRCRTVHKSDTAEKIGRHTTARVAISKLIFCRFSSPDLNRIFRDFFFNAVSGKKNLWRKAGEIFINVKLNKSFTQSCKPLE